MKASDYIVSFLAEQGVERVYEMCGGMIAHLLDSLDRDGRISVMSMHHEQAAGFAAEAEARITGVPGVAMATSGPGATNLVTAIGSCYFDSVPAVFITGQVNTYEQRGDSGVRQSGFQETDIVAVAGPIAKAAFAVRSADELPHLLAESFRIALEGRPGPVVLDIPMDVQRAELGSGVSRAPAPERSAASPDDMSSVLELIELAERPLVLAGGGIRSARAAELLDRAVSTLSLPVVVSLPAVDVLPASHPLRVGLIGTYGNRWANEALGRADLLLVLGSRLDVRQTGADVERFIAGKKIVRVDVDTSETAYRVPATLAVHCDLVPFLEQLARADSALGRSAWLSELAELREAFPDAAELADVPGVNPVLVMHGLSEMADQAVAFTADVGQNQIWAAQSLRLRPGQRFLTSAGMGAMGFALPAAIGAALASPGGPVVAIMGDGGAQVNIQELETVARLALPVKIVVLDNGCLGMVRQFQDEYFDGRHVSTVKGYGAPDFARVAEAFGLVAKSVERPDEVEAGLAWLMADPAQPALLHVRLSRWSRVRPKVAFGKPVFEMDPPPSGTGLGV